MPDGFLDVDYERVIADPRAKPAACRFWASTRMAAAVPPARRGHDRQRRAGVADLQQFRRHGGTRANSSTGRTAAQRGIDVDAV
jgi:hypothetical protein